MWFSNDYIHRVIKCCYTLYYIFIDLITLNFDKYRTFTLTNIDKSATIHLSDYENLSLKKYGEIVDNNKKENALCAKLLPTTDNNFIKSYLSYNISNLAKKHYKEKNKDIYISYTSTNISWCK
jgi:hypothetical protein